MRSIVRLAAVAGIAVTGLCAPSAVRAADPLQLPPETPSHQVVPEASGSSDGPLGDRLERSGGVLRPPAGIDSGIAQTPRRGGKTPVIPPPGTPGGEPGATPK